MKRNKRNANSILAGMIFSNWLFDASHPRCFYGKELNKVKKFMFQVKMDWEVVSKLCINSNDWRNEFNAFPGINDGSKFQDHAIEKRELECFEIGIRFMELAWIYDGGCMGCLDLVNKLNFEFWKCLSIVGISESCFDKISKLFDEFLGYEDDFAMQKKVADALACYIE